MGYTAHSPHPCHGTCGTDSTLTPAKGLAALTAHPLAWGLAAIPPSRSEVWHLLGCGCGEDPPVEVSTPHASMPPLSKALLGIQ